MIPATIGPTARPLSIEGCASYHPDIDGWGSSGPFNEAGLVAFRTRESKSSAHPSDASDWNPLARCLSVRPNQFGQHLVEDHPVGIDRLRGIRPSAGRAG